MRKRTTCARKRCANLGGFRSQDRERRTMKTNLFSRILFGTSVVFLASALANLAAESRAEKQQRLIAILKSDAPPQDKAIPCKQLAIYGDKDTVPALAPLLADTN